MNSTVKPENDIAGTATQRPLLSRDFVLLVAGQGISLFGNVMLRFAMSMWVLDETGSATIFASVLAISIVPTILLSRSEACWPDRVNRRTIMWRSTPSPPCSCWRAPSSSPPRASIS